MRMADPSASNNPVGPPIVTRVEKMLYCPVPCGVDRDVRQVAHVIGMIHIGIGIARWARIEVAAGALEVWTLASAGSVNVDAMHARRRILHGQDDLHHVTVAAVCDFIQRRGARHAAGAFDRRARGLDRRPSAALTLQLSGDLRGQAGDSAPLAVGGLRRPAVAAPAVGAWVPAPR